MVPRARSRESRSAGALRAPPRAARVAAVAAALFAVRARRESLLPPVGMALVPPGGDAAPELDPEFEPVDLPGDPPETPPDLLR